MARLCLVTPGHLSTNPRIVKEADALADAGHDVRVIAADFARWARAAEAEFIERPWQREAPLRFGPLAPLAMRVRQTTCQRSARLAAKLGLRGEMIERAACHPIGPDLAKVACRTPADLYVAHYVAALPAAAQAARRHGARYAFDAEDFHLGDLPDLPQHAFEKRLIHAIESRYLPDCAYVTAASPGIADAYVDAYGIKRPQVVLNVFPLTQAPPGPTMKGTAEPSPSVYWFSQTIGPDRGLECAVQAVARARTRPHLYLRGTPAAGFVGRLQEIAAGCGAVGRLHILPPDEPDKMEQLAASHDIGLVAENGKTRSRAIALTNKLFTFLLAGLPVVMSDIPAHCAFAAEAGMTENLYPADNSEALASVIDRLLGDPARLAAARAAAYRLGQERYNWERESRALLQTVQHALELGSGQAARSPAMSQ